MILQGVNGLIIRDRGRSNPYSDIAQLIGGSFGGLPGSIRSWLLDNVPNHPSETDSLINDNDSGIRKVPDFMNRWNNAVTLSTEVDQIRGDPASAALNQKENGLEQALLNDLLNARSYHPFDQLFGRSDKNNQGLAAAYASLDNHLTQYMNEVGALYKQAQSDITARVQAAARLAIDQQNQQDALAILSAKQSNRDTTVAEAQRADANVVALNAQAAEVQTQVNTSKLIAAAQAPTLFGLPLSVVVPVGIAGAVGLTMLLMHKPAPSAMGGYRRKVRR